jgi:hypothetical protein
MKPTDNKVIFNGLTYKLVLDEPEPEWKPSVGELCEFCDWKNFEKPNLITIAYYAGVEFSRYKDSTEKTYTYCRPLQNPNIIQMIPHDGGDCPVLGWENVLIRFRDGYMENRKPKGLDWSHTNNPRDIMFYAVLK